MGNVFEISNPAFNNIIGEIAENGQQMTVHNHCAESCREGVKKLWDEVLFLRNLTEHQTKIIEQMQDQKKSLIDLIILQRGDFMEELKFEIQKIKGVDND